MASFGGPRPGTGSKQWGSPAPTEIKMYTNNLFQDGDVLGGEEEPAADSPPAVEAYVMQQNPSPFKGQLQAPIQSPGSPKVSAAQKRLERLQLNSGLATSNDYMQSSRPSSASMTAGANRTGSLGQSFDRNGSVGSPGGLRSSIGGPLGTILADRGSIGSGRSTESAGGASPMQRNTGSSGGAWSASEPSNLRSSSEARTMSSAAAAAAGVAQQHSPPITAFSDEHIRRSSSSSQGQAPQQHQAQALSHLRVQQLQQQGSGITVSRSGSEVEDMDADEVLPIDSGTPRSPIVPVMVDTSDMRRFLMAPGPREGPVQCYILRDKGSSRMYPRYSVFLEQGQQLMLSARKRKKTTSSYYVIGLDPDDLSRDSKGCFGKLKANFVGTGFSFFAGGAAKPPGVDEKLEQGCVGYQTNVLGTRGPRKMTAIIPSLREDSKPAFVPTHSGETLMDRYKSDGRLGELVVMQNKPPKWNEALNAYCLNFNGRVTEASVKNFQLVADFDREHVILQFGKVGKHAFTMDYQWPINALQAFSICLSSFDSKLACE